MSLLTHWLLPCNKGDRETKKMNKMEIFIAVLFSTSDVYKAAHTSEMLWLREEING